MDRETKADQYFPEKRFSENEIKLCAQSFLGTSEQIPPMYSAVKKDGIALYVLARKGKKVKVDPRKIVIHEFKIESINLPFIDFRVKSSKGTYIRSLVSDLGQKLGSGAYLNSLRRESVGEYQVRDSFQLESLVNSIQNAQ